MLCCVCIDMCMWTCVPWISYGDWGLFFRPTYPTLARPRAFKDSPIPAEITGMCSYAGLHDCVVSALSTEPPS